jgi:hypothetical protein
MRRSIRLSRRAAPKRRKWCGILAPSSPFSQRRTCDYHPGSHGDRRPRSICSLHIRSQESPVRHSRSRFVAPETDAKRPSRKEETKGLRTIRTAVPLPSGQHSTCGPATAPSILVSALARANVSPKLLLNLQRDLMRDVKSGGFGPRPESPPFSCGIYY